MPKVLKWSISILIILILTGLGYYFFQKKIPTGGVGENQPFLVMYGWDIKEGTGEFQPDFGWLKLPEEFSLRLSIYENGNVLYFDHFERQIKEVRTGNLDKRDIDKLKAFIINKEFLKLKDYYSDCPEDPNIECERPLRSVRIKFIHQNKVKLVFEQGSAGPDNLHEIQKRLYEIAKKLKKSENYGPFIKASEVEKERKRDIEESAKQRGEYELFKFHRFSPENLDPYLSEAINRPEEFVYVGSWDKTEIDNLIIENIYFFIDVDGKYYQIEVYEYKK